MSFPPDVTPNPGIHNPPAIQTGVGPADALAMLGRAGNVSTGTAIPIATALTGAVGAAGPFAALAAFGASALGAVAQIAQMLEELGVTTISDFVKIIQAAENAATSVIIDVEQEIASAIKAAVNDTVTIGEDALGAITNMFKDLFGLLGNPSGVGSGTGSTTDANGYTLAQLINAMQSGDQVTTAQLAHLAPAAAPNKLTDPGFNKNAGIQGNGQWIWDGWIGTGASSGVNSSIRTVRPGLITIYNIVGTSQGTYMWGNEPIGEGGSGIVLEYLRTNLLGWLGTAVDWTLTGTDPTYFEWINVPYPAASYPMGPSVQAGHDWLVSAINQIPGPFFFVMDSQGNQVGASVYDELRYGTLQSRNNDFLGALALGNLRREEGHYFPGCPDLAPGTSGMCCASLMTTGPYKGSNNPADPKIGNLIDTEDRWWDFAVPGDYFACTPLKGNTVDPGPNAIGGNVGDIAGIPAITMRQFYSFVNFNNHNASVITNWLNYATQHGLSGGTSILSDFMGKPMQLINQLGGPDSPHQCYYKDTRPLASLGDNRTFMEIGLDYLHSFAGGYHPDGIPIAPPPVGGVRHQYALQRYAVQPFQVVTAGASAMWINIPENAGDAIIVCVNAYDSSGNLIATVTADQCVISNPPTSSNWVFNPLQADFVMPDGAASACLVLDVEPEAMTTGIVWFDDLIFEVDNLIDGAMIHSPTLTGIPGEAVAGPQGQADILTAWQNMIDQLASSHSQTPITGVQFADMLQSVGQTALNANLAYQLGVSHQQILGNVSTQPFWSGLQPTGQVTFPLPTGTLPSVTISAGTALGAFINTAPALTVGFVEFMAKASATPSGVYLNVYTVDQSTGNQTNVWASADLSSSISTSSFAWVGVDISSAQQPQFPLSQWVYWEIVSQGSAITVVAETLGQPNKTYQFPPNVGASRTTSSSGGVSPTSLTPSQMSYGGTAPFVCMSATDVAPTYEPPNVKDFTSGTGMYTYDIPSWAQVSGATFDIPALGGGGAGGDASGYSNPGILGFGASSSIKYGQGGMPGGWATKTLTYGTEIPSGTTALTVFIGAGGCAPSGRGGKTIIGYNFTTPPQFDAVGPGATTNGTTLSWSHTAAAGAYVIVAFTQLPDTAPNTPGSYDVTYGGTAMIPLQAVYNANSGRSAMMLFGLENAPAGASTVTINFTKKSYLAGNSISFTNVSSVGLVTNTYGHGASLSHQVDCDTNQLIVQAFSHQGYGQLSALSGGTNEFYGSYPHPGTSPGVSLSYATSNTTFTAKASASENWGSVALALNPAGTVLVSAPGGEPGGHAALPNPNNPNTRPTGKGAPNKSWAGRNYAGSADTTATAFPGNPWGGGSSSGNLNTVAQNAGDGASWIIAKQPPTVAITGGAIGTGGSELTVAYEATGGGGENTSGATLSWTHTSSGGPNTAVILIGSVDYSSGAAVPTATYGNLTLNNLADVTFYNANGVAVAVFILGLIGLPSGTKTVTLSAGSATINDLAGNTMSYNNVGSFGNFYTNNGHGTSLSLPGIPAASGDMVVAGFAEVTHTLVNYSQTLRWAQNNIASIPMLIGDAAGASSVGFTATNGGTDYWGAIGGVLIPQS